ncbi:hypothetical protein EDB80DRAFT_827235 [Ilyonectria destructans]|nr:hypothetical protein EDB80DRAFT_827235 [Ilyonectria destructans]
MATDLFWEKVPMPLTWKSEFNYHMLNGKPPPAPENAETERIRHSPTAHLGALEVFPFDILCQILPDLDVYGLNSFRRVNRLAMEVVESLTLYKEVTRYAHQAVRGALSIGTGHYMSYRLLYEKLCTRKCETCSNFAGYLFLFTCKRVCFACVSRKEIFLPLELSHATQRFGLDPHLLEDIPRMTLIPGIHSQRSKEVTATTALLDKESAYQIGVSFHGSEQAMLRLAAKKERRMGYEDELARLLRDNHWSAWHRGNYWNPLRYVAVVSFPWLDRSSHELQWNMYHIVLRSDNWYRVWGQYSAETLRKHYQMIRTGRFHSLQGGHRIQTGPWRPPLLPWL